MMDEKAIARLIAAIDNIAEILDKPRESDPAYEYLAKQIERANNINEQSLKQREEWQKIELDHMKVCERRYHALIKGQPVDEPISH